MATRGHVSPPLPSLATFLGALFFTDISTFSLYGTWRALDQFPGGFAPVYHAPAPRSYRGERASLSLFCTTRSTCHLEYTDPNPASDYNHS